MPYYDKFKKNAIFTYTISSLNMQTFTVQITNNNALKTLHSLEEKHFIRIVEETSFDSPALPGVQLNLKAFKNWISDAENAPTVDLKEAKAKWASKRKQLQKLIR
jgi:hypothetical protein